MNSIGHRSPKKPTNGLLSPTIREKRTLDVVKSILFNVKEKVTSSGPLLSDEEAAIAQLEQLYLTKFLRPTITSRQESESGSSVATPRRGSGEHSSSPFVSSTPTRRDSDASYSNDTHSSSAFFSNGGGGRIGRPRRGEKDSSYYNYNNRDSWRRQWQRRKRAEERRNVKPLILRGVEGARMVDAVMSIYENTLREGKRAQAAYDLLITTLRSYFANETWPDLVDAYVVQFLRNHLLLKTTELVEKYSTSNTRGAVDRLDEYKFQVLLHLFSLPSDSEPRKEELDEVIKLLQTVSSSFGGSTDLHKFLDEDVLESFMYTIPQDLVALYREMDISLPSELTSFTKGDKSTKQKKPQPNSTVERPSTNDDNFVAPAPLTFDIVPKKRGRPPKRKEPEVPTVEMEEEVSKPKKLKLERTLDDIEEEVPTTTMEKKETKKKPIGKKTEAKTPAKKQMPTGEFKKIKTEPPSSAQSKPKKPSSNSTCKMATEVPEDASSMLVSVRQSPRHHASTRALYGGSSNSLSSLLLQKEQATSGRNGLVSAAAGTSTAAAMAGANNAADDSTRLVLVKDKRGYILKQFRHDKTNDDEDEDDEDAMASNAHLGALEPEEEDDEPEKKPVPKLTLKLKTLPVKKSPTKSTPMSKKIPTANGRIVTTIKMKNTGGMDNNRSNTTVGTKKSPTKSDSGSNGKAKGTPANTKIKIQSNGKAKGRQTPAVVSVNGKEKIQSITIIRSPPTTSKTTHSIAIIKPCPTTPTKSSTVRNTKPSTPAIENGSSSKSTPSKSRNPDYALPTFAVNNYTRHINDIRRERKRARFDPEDGDELFYARGTRRHSIFYDGSDDSTKAAASKCYADEQMAPKNRTGRKLKSSVEVFHLANYLLNIQNGNPSAPTVPKNLQQTLNTPIRLYKKLRLAPKNNNRRRSLRQFCALKFNADEFKTSLDNSSSGGETSNSSAIMNMESDDCVSLELNGPGRRNSINKETAATSSATTSSKDVKTTLSIDMKLINGTRRNSVGICSSAISPPKTWTTTVEEDVNEEDEDGDEESKNGYYLRRRRRLFSDGHVTAASSSSSSSVISPGFKSTKSTSTVSLRGRREDLEEVKKKLKEVGGGNNGSGLVLTIGTRAKSGTNAVSSLAPKEYYVIAANAKSLCDDLMDESNGGEKTRNGDASFLNRLSNGGLLQLAASTPTSLLCTGLT